VPTPTMGPASADSDLTLAPAGSRLFPSASPPWAWAALAPEDTHMVSAELDQSEVQNAAHDDQHTHAKLAITN
jgi:hypothetical protein